MLRNRDEQETTKLHGVNLAVDPIKLQFGYFERLQNWVPAQRLKLKKKRGVQTVPEGDHFPVELNCPCPADTLPTGNQPLGIAHCYDYNAGGNNASQLNFVGGNPFVGAETFVVSLSAQSGVGIPYSTAGTNPDILLATGETIASTTVLPLDGGKTATFVGQSAQAGSSGHSDEKSILYHMSDITPNVAGQSAAKVYFSYETSAISYFLYESGTVTSCWAKRGDRYWDLASNASGHTIERYSVAAALTGATPAAYGDLGLADNANIQDLDASDSFLYMLYNDFGGTAVLYRLDLDTMAVVHSWNLTGALNLAVNISVFSDDRIYIRSWNNLLTPDHWRFGYFIPSMFTLQQIGSDVAAGCIGHLGLGLPGQNSFHYNSAYFYLGYGGFGVGNTNVAKVGPLVCPGTNRPIGS